MEHTKDIPGTRNEDAATCGDWKRSRKEGALIQLRAWMAQADLAVGSQLPPERELSEMLGITRNELRKALLVLEGEGQVWRHVGKGTFIGSRPVDALLNLRSIEQQTNLAEVMRTRLIMESAIAREAALNANQADIESMLRCLKACREATSWRIYERHDNELHQLVAEATHNNLLIALYDALNAVRRTITWTRKRGNEGGPPADHHSFGEHDKLVEAIRTRDIEGAERAMYEHLRMVEHRLLAPATAPAMTGS